MTLRIKEILKDKGITGTALSELMTAKGYSLSQVSISNIVSGKHSPKVETLEQIADTIDVSVSDLFDSVELQPIYTKNEDGSYTQIGTLNK